ncbi:RNA-binding protein [Paraferrimonas sp. SM1919]|uniref:RNA recognition motif domain-containing protein n=1 Tax=Paraferrimonas sp. SM1919 TaxID=2662263 RepID=UPI0013CF7106|nr:RNA-binding protein [Paraferrimonas sp. SM1919]
MFKSVLVGIVVAVIGFLVLDVLDVAAMISPPPGITFAVAAIVTAVVIACIPSPSVSSSDDEEFTTLYVGNLPYRVHEGDVRDLFAQYGLVNSVRLVRDRKTNKRKGFGFVEMSSSGAIKAMKKLNDNEFQERTLKVREAKSQERKD